MRSLLCAICMATPSAFLIPHKTSGPQLAWFNAPKVARSFSTTVLLHANSTLSDEAAKYSAKNWENFVAHYPPGAWFKQEWPTTCPSPAVSKAVYSKYEGNFVGMFRQPEQRLLSAYNSVGLHVGGIRNYAKRVEGSVVKQLAGQEPGDKRLAWPPGGRACSGTVAAKHEPSPEPDVELAIRRLNEGFKFVGLAEEYDLSVCLFHAIFGGECRQAEFEHLSPGNANFTQQDTSVLEGYTDMVDGRLYEEAKKIFREALTVHKVRRGTCQRLICPNVTGVFDVPNELSLTVHERAKMEMMWEGRRPTLNEEWV